MDQKRIFNSRALTKINNTGLFTPFHTQCKFTRIRNGKDLCKYIQTGKINDGIDQKGSNGEN
jgi:hypothetical protein